MNPDGTAQTDYYGNNSMFPAAIIHAHGIPGSQKAMAVIAGHHSIYKGKLGLIDRTQGMQAGKGIEFVNTKLNGDLGRESADFIRPEPPDPSKPYLDLKIDVFGQFGPQYSHPYAFDEENYLCSFCPEGYLPPFGPFNPPLGVYYMKPDGVRELLAFDDWQGTGQAIPVMARRPPAVRASLVRPRDNYGVYTIQDVYQGPGLAGIARGTAKKLRVVALEYRVARMGYGQNGGECETGLCQTPISLNSGSWDVKHVLGEVDIEADGSCSFEVPAHTPVYFQVLDAKGYTIQSMRSWSTLQNGERFSCIGCHENKLEAGPRETTDPEYHGGALQADSEAPALCGQGASVDPPAGVSVLAGQCGELPRGQRPALARPERAGGRLQLRAGNPAHLRSALRELPQRLADREEQDQPDRRGGPAGEREADRRGTGGSQAGLHAVVRHDHHLGQSRPEPVDDVVEAPQPHRDAPAVPHGGVQEQDHGLLRARPLRRARSARTKNARSPAGWICSFPSAVPTRSTTPGPTRKRPNTATSRKNAGPMPPPNWSRFAGRRAIEPSRAEQLRFNTRMPSKAMRLTMKRLERRASIITGAARHRS